MKPAFSFLLIVVACALTVAQSSQESTQAGHASGAMIAGVVTRDPGSEPVRKALIELIGENQSDEGNYTALTGSDGTFHIEDIRPGRYRLFAERTGFLEVDKRRPRSQGRLLTLTPGQELKEVVIRLQAVAVIAGRITDEDGDPLPNAQVTVLRQTFVAGHNHWEQAGAEHTNDLGDYRVAGLAPGKYYLSVTPPLDFESLIASSSKTPAPGAADAGKNHPEPAPAYQTTYYPGTRDRGQAAPIQLQAGEEMPVHFFLTRSPSLAIRGSIANLAAGASAVVMLRGKDFTLVQHSAEVRQDGGFELRGIAPGTYTLMAAVSGGPAPMLARQSVEVVSGNVEGVKLVPQVSGTIRGRLRLDLAGGGGMGRNAELALFSVFLRPDESDDDPAGLISFGEGFIPVAQVNPDGRFEWKEVPPGHYQLELETGGVPDWFLKSAGVGSRDVRDTGITINGRAASLDLVASPHAALVDGVVTGPDGRPVADAVVVAVPAAHLRRRSDRYAKTTTDQSGRFTLRGLTPGDYTLLAWEFLDGEPYFDPQYLKNCEGQGIGMRLEEGERRRVQMQVIPPGEAQ